MRSRVLDNQEFTSSNRMKQSSLLNPPPCREDAATVCSVEEGAYSPIVGIPTEFGENPQFGEKSQGESVYLRLVAPGQVDRCIVNFSDSSRWRSWVRCARSSLPTMCVRRGDGGPSGYL